MPPAEPIMPPKPNTTPVAPRPKHKSRRKRFAWGLLFLIILVASSLGSYYVGKSNERVIIRAPIPPPITLPPQAVVVKDCVPGLGKQYILPKDIPNGPIYDVENSKVIAVEYNYKAIDLFTNPNRLSNTIIPLTKHYQLTHFTTVIGDLKGGTAADVQQVPIHLTMYVASKAEAAKITCLNK